MKNADSAVRRMVLAVHTTQPRECKTPTLGDKFRLVPHERKILRNDRACGASQNRRFARRGRGTRDEGTCTERNPATEPTSQKPITHAQCPLPLSGSVYREDTKISWFMPGNNGPPTAHPLPAQLHHEPTRDLAGLATTNAPPPPLAFPSILASDPFPSPRFPSCCSQHR